MQRVALLIAVEEYQRFGPTNFCHADAKLLGSTLVRSCDFAEQDVETLLLAPGDGVTPSAIVDRVEHIVSTLRVGDTVLFFFAGHGHLASGEPYLILPDTTLDDLEHTGLPLRTIADRLRAPERINIRILDACHAGADVRDTIDSGGFVRGALERGASGWITFAACRDDEFSQGDRGLGNGIFTHFLAESLTEADPGPIYPETVKLRICEKVEAYLLTKPHLLRQTPTFNASISGNLAIATRSSRPPQPETAGIPRAGDSGAPSPSLENRLTQVRSAGALGADVHLAVLRELYGAARTEAEDAARHAEGFGCQISVGPDHHADRIPPWLRRRVVDHVLDMGFQPIHKLTRKRRDSANPVGLAISSLVGVKPEYDYEIGQEWNWPDCFFLVTHSSDGLAPEAQVGVYLLPLQVSAALIVGIRVSAGAFGSERRNVSVEMTHVTIPLGDLDAQAKIRAHVLQSFEAYARMYEEALTKRLEYLEWEAGSAVSD